MDNIVIKGARQNNLKNIDVDSIIDSRENVEEICIAIQTAMSDSFKEMCKKTLCPYGDGHAAERIADQIICTVQHGNIDLKKKFYNI